MSDVGLGAAVEWALGLWGVLSDLWCRQMGGTSAMWLLCYGLLLTRWMTTLMFTWYRLVGKSGHLLTCSCSLTGLAKAFVETMDRLVGKWTLPPWVMVMRSPRNTGLFRDMTVALLPSTVTLRTALTVLKLLLLAHRLLIWTPWCCVPLRRVDCRWIRQPVFLLCLQLMRPLLTNTTWERLSWLSWLTTLLFTRAKLTLMYGTFALVLGSLTDMNGIFAVVVMVRWSLLTPMLTSMILLMSLALTSCVSRLLLPLLASRRALQLRNCVRSRKRRKQVKQPAQSAELRMGESRVMKRASAAWVVRLLGLGMQLTLSVVVRISCSAVGETGCPFDTMHEMASTDMLVPFVMLPTLITLRAFTSFRWRSFGLRFV